MDKQSFLSQPEVALFKDRLANWLSGDRFMEHPFHLRDKALPIDFPRHFSASTLETCFDHYHWGGLDYEDNRKQRELLHQNLQQALSSADTDALLAALDAALRWSTGGKGIKLYSQNQEWAEAHKDTLTAHMREALQTLESDNPDTEAFNERLRMNVGFTKVYALASDKLIMYDGRIGAALGLLARQHCMRKRMDLPAALCFPWAPGASSLNRNPSDERYHFRQLANRGGFHAEWMARASWLVTAAIEQAQAPWCKGPDALRRVEAALFMLGYEIPTEENHSKQFHYL